MPRRSLTLPVLATTALVAAAGASVPATTAAATLKSYGRATVASVDGPGLMTVKVGRRALPVRLHFVDVPRGGECGAAETTAALRGFVRRAPRKVQYALVNRSEGGYMRDLDGRFQANVSYVVRPGERREFGADLLRAEWGHLGERATLDQPSRLPNGYVAQSEYSIDEGYENVEMRPRRGLWALCGGLAHLPLGQAPPASAPAPWTVDEHGIAQQIGPLTLTPDLTPGGAMRLGQLAAVAPAEITRFYQGCRAWFPSLQVYAQSADSSDRCADTYVTLVSSAGPDPALLSRGGGVGRSANELFAAFPLLAREQSRVDWRLSGSDLPQWAWQTQAYVGDDRRVVSLTTYASPPMPWN